MISKLLVLACVAAAANALEATKEAAFVKSVHDDKWCHEHHLGEGATFCKAHNGCCFSPKVELVFKGLSRADKLVSQYGPCHSCNSHENGWCAAFGVPPKATPEIGEVWDNCIANSGCTYEDGKCLAVPPKSEIEVHNCAKQKVDAADSAGLVAAYQTCLDAAYIVEDAEKAANALLHKNHSLPERDLPNYRLFLKSVEDGGCQDLYAYAPLCDEKDSDLYAPSQSDTIRHKNSDKVDGQYFCVDKNGHEIPNTRKQEPLDTAGINIDCVEERKRHAGYQCPNSSVLTSSGGVVEISTVSLGDCSGQSTCQTDADCEGWCCFDNCQYSCQTPVKPFTGCADPPVNREVGQALLTVDNAAAPFRHEMQIKVACRSDFSVPLGMPSAVTLTCSHGRWLTDYGETTFDLKCMQQCGAFNIEDTGKSVIDDLSMNDDDFIIEGDDNFFGSSRTIQCQPNYGIVAGSKNVLANKEDVLVCGADGSWGEEFTNARRSIECSVCFDDPTFIDVSTQNSCLHYQSRSSECTHGATCTGADCAFTALTPAQQNCRVACRTCRKAEMAYGIVDVISSEDFNALPSKDLNGLPIDNLKKWKQIAGKIKVYKNRTVYTMKSVTTVTSVPVSRACKSTTSGDMMLANENADGTFSCENGYAIMSS